MRALSTAGIPTYRTDRNGDVRLELSPRGPTITSGR
jgi:beta-lactamase superfamily II metal-dependent hydrolase